MRIVAAMAYVAWALLIVIAHSRFGARIRYVIASLIGFVLGLVISTTGKPVADAAPLGLVIGSGIAIGTYLLIREEVRFEWAPGQAYDVDPGPYPRIEAVSLWILAGFALLGLLTALF